ncbi:MAG: hypothetical protein BGO67_13045 [Alphaproteobacteria bacterium 41-28]|nr:MAG: hypothetical protein BGO67_13045 [Alphaproteobacteria bacterium 41-28]
MKYSFFLFWVEVLFVSYSLLVLLRVIYLFFEALNLVNATRNPLQSAEWVFRWSVDPAINLLNFIGIPYFLSLFVIILVILILYHFIYWSLFE